MTLRRPEDRSIVQWCFEGLNLKTVVLLIISLCGCYYTMGTRVTVIESDKKADKTETDRRFDDVGRQLDLQRDAIKSKLDKDTYEADQRRLAEELTAIRDTTGRIEEILMERQRK